MDRQTSGEVPSVFVLHRYQKARPVTWCPARVPSKRVRRVTGFNAVFSTEVRVTCKKFEHRSSSALRTSLSPRKPLLLLLLLLDEATGAPTYSKAARGGQRPERAKSGLTSCCTQPSGRAARHAARHAAALARAGRFAAGRGWSIDLSTYHLRCYVATTRLQGSPR
jgi:hypothetical protein